MINDLREDCHGQKLKVFWNSSFKETEDVKGNLGYHKDEVVLIEGLYDVRTAGNRTKVLVKWCGFEDAESDWVGIASFKEDDPDLLYEFIVVMKAEGME